MISEFELGWLVGILEGEGYFGYYTASQYIEVTMADEDTICKVAVLFERLTGKQCNITERQQKGKPQTYYRARLGGDSARLVMKLVVKHMSVRRRKKIWQSLNRYQQQKPKVPLREVCKNIIPFKEVINE